MDFRKTIIRQFTPMIKEYLPALENMLINKLQAVNLNEGEEFTSYNLVNIRGKLKIILCTYNTDNKVIREIETLDANEVILNLINNI